MSSANLCSTRLRAALARRSRKAGNFAKRNIAAANPIGSFGLTSSPVSPSDHDGNIAATEAATAGRQKPSLPEGHWKSPPGAMAKRKRPQQPSKRSTAGCSPSHLILRSMRTPSLCLRVALRFPRHGQLLAKAMDPAAGSLRVQGVQKILVGLLYRKRLATTTITRVSRSMCNSPRTCSRLPRRPVAATRRRYK